MSGMMVKAMQVLPAGVRPCARATRDEKTARTMNGRIAIDTTAKCMGLDFIHKQQPSSIRQTTGTSEATHAYYAGKDATLPERPNVCTRFAQGSRPATLHKPDYPATVADNQSPLLLLGPNGT